MDYKELVENNLQEIANLIVILTTSKHLVEGRLAELSNMLAVFANIRGDSGLFVAENLQKTNNPLLTNARLFARDAFARAKDPEFIKKHITTNPWKFYYKEDDLKRNILEPLGSATPEFNLPLGNLTRLRIGVYGDLGLKEQRDNIAKMLKTDIRDKTMSIYDALLELNSKMKYVDEFISKFSLLQCFEGRFIEKGRYVAQEKVWREYVPGSHERDPDWYGTSNSVIC